MEKKYIMSIDQGTTSTRVVIYDLKGNEIIKQSAGHKQIYPKHGWVSHDAEEIYRNIIFITRSVIEKSSINPEEIACIGITNQRETVVAWDKNTGKPLADAIVWQCKRTSHICEEIKKDKFDNYIHENTGLVIDPYFSGTKIKWLLENDENVSESMRNGNLLFGTMDSFIIWKLTNGIHVTDYSNASRTMLFNIHTLEWDKEILKYFNIDINTLPKVVPSSGIVGETHPIIFGVEIPISGIAGDQHAALFGQGCYEEGCIKNTYGTGCFILQNIGEKPIISDNGLLTTIAWNIKGKTTYAVEGSIFVAGSSLEWLIKEMKIVSDVNEINDICNSLENSDGVYVIPAFNGMGSPFWNMYAKGVICGLSLSSTREHIVRATMEAIAFQTRSVLDFMQQETKIKTKSLNVDGGISNSDFLMQFQADLLGLPVQRPKSHDITAFGVALLAGLGVGVWNNQEEIVKHIHIDKTYKPSNNSTDIELNYAKWLEEVNRSLK